MSHFTIGILAHVDAGKTTLSEALLYHTGVLRQRGHVDNGDTFLDFGAIERERGITITTKQADFQIDNFRYTLIDTPGHSDFSFEMERALQALDLAILVISGTDLIQSHTETIIQLLNEYRIPTLAFINKCDRPLVLIDEVKKKLNQFDPKFVPLSFIQNHLSNESIEYFSLNDENLLHHYLEEDWHSDNWLEAMRDAFDKRQVIPSIFGSALTGDGVDTLIQALKTFIPKQKAKDYALAQIYKVIHENDQRIALVKVLGGQFSVKDTVYSHQNNEGEKINQLLHLNGHRFQSLKTAYPFDLCGMVGLNNVQAGDYITLDRSQLDESSHQLYTEPVFETTLLIPSSLNPSEFVKYLTQLADEQPELSIKPDRDLTSVNLKVMGKIQMEVLAQTLNEQFNVPIEFDEFRIIYKETIDGSIDGYAHFEPLGHYAEVKINIAAAPRGNGISVESACHVDQVELRHQNLILSHLLEKDHLGVLTGSSLTDVHLTLKAALYSQKNSRGGDFRFATYRAVRQGLMQAKSILLEPWYHFTIHLPLDMVGKVITDIEKAKGDYLPPEFTDNQRATITGQAPVATFYDYPLELATYAKRQASMTLKPNGYHPCHNAEEVIQRINYDPERDLDNTPNSIFFTKGAGFEVKWHEIDHYRHIKD